MGAARVLQRGILDDVEATSAPQSAHRQVSSNVAVLEVRRSLWRHSLALHKSPRAPAPPMHLHSHARTPIDALVFHHSFNSCAYLQYVICVEWTFPQFGVTYRFRERCNKPDKMQGVKHAAANAKEKVGNLTAKVEEKMDKGKASAAEKVWILQHLVTLELWERG